MKQQRKCNYLDLRANDWKVGKKKKKIKEKNSKQNKSRKSVFSECFAKHVYEIQKIPNPSLLMLLFSLKNIIFA